MLLPKPDYAISCARSRRSSLARRPPARRPRPTPQLCGFGHVLVKAAEREPAVEIKFSIPDNWARQLFTALCRRYGISPFRYRRMRRQTLWPEFRELSGALSTNLTEITEKLIREEVHGETADAEEREEPRRLGR